LLLVGDEGAEDHHDVELQNQTGRVLGRAKLPEGIAGVARLHAMIGEHLGQDHEPAQVVVGIETDRGPWVQALAGAGYQVYAINPLQVARYRERHSTSGAKSDAADAHLLAEIVRLDRGHHRRVAGDSEIAEHIKIATRAHQTMLWSRVRQVNALRSLLREYYPAALAAFGADLASADALAVLAAAPSPEQGRRLSQARIETLLRRGGRQRNVTPTAAKIRAALSSDQLTARPGVVPAYAASASALIAVLTAMVQQIEVLAGQVEQGFGQHPDAEIYRSQPGLGVILGGRVLAEFGDDPGLTPTHGAGRTTPACHRSPRPPAPNASCWPAMPGIGGSATRCSYRPTRRCGPHPAPDSSTTASGLAARPTTKPSAPWQTGWSASSTDACATTPFTTNTEPGTPPTRS
jgi:transposase